MCIRDRYRETEKKADILRILPEDIAQKLRIDIGDIDEINYESMLAKVNNYVRNLTGGNASMDIGSLDHPKPQDGKSDKEEERGPEDGKDQQEWPEQDMNYTGDKRKGKGK
eukprot:8400840-Karenia_brevis.AAC.1